MIFIQVVMPGGRSARRRGVSKHEPFAFLTRVSKKSIQARRLEDELTSRMEMEEQVCYTP